MWHISLGHPNKSHQYVAIVSPEDDHKIIMFPSDHKTRASAFHRHKRQSNQSHHEEKEPTNQIQESSRGSQALQKCLHVLFGTGTQAYSKDSFQQEGMNEIFSTHWPLATRRKRKKTNRTIPHKNYCCRYEQQKLPSSSLGRGKTSLTKTGSNGLSWDDVTENATSAKRPTTRDRGRFPTLSFQMHLRDPVLPFSRSATNGGRGS